jgi:histidine phosphotransferase ChpT
LAFGAAGSAGASIDTGDAEKVARGLFADQRTRLDWQAPRLLMPKNQVKLILNLCLIAAGAIPRGGVITVTTRGADEQLSVSVTAQGANAKLSSQASDLLAGTPGQAVDAQGIQAYYTGLVAKAANMTLMVVPENDVIRFEAFPAASSAAEEAAA